MRFDVVLCPIDFSDASKSALVMAIRCARKFHAALHVIHVVHLSPAQSWGSFGQGLAPFDVAGYEKAVTDAAKQRLSATVEALSASGVAIQSRILHGGPAREILRYAETIHADLIVVSTQGGSGWDGVVTGGVTEKIVRHARCPVLVVPPEPTPAVR